MSGWGAGPKAKPSRKGGSYPGKLLHGRYAFLGE